MLIDLIKEKKLTIKNFGIYNRAMYPDHTMVPEKHERLEIMYVEDGEMIFSIYNNEKADPIMTTPIKKGDFVFINSNIIHYISFNIKSRVLNLEFELAAKQYDSTENYLAILNNFPSFVKFAESFTDYIILTDISNVIAELKAIHYFLLNEYYDSETSSIKEIRIVALLLLISRCNKYKKYNTGSLAINNAIRLIHKNIQNTIFVSSIAKQIGISDAYLQRLFKKTMGKTVVEYINEIRIEKAKKLLCNTTFPIIEIGMETGFNTRQNFIYAFKKYTNLSPIEYRERNKNFFIRDIGDKMDPTETNAQKN